ncbi:hypothetical protein PMAYCL1PPCAC_26550 [Pristionchus mayeri]|uniref:Uncharacterized protein n=1 Tax=Pristionchus mayeri TaxID=1317129 RepID=A0AAN5I9S2_9BILA|nr:hypothetical protein PMAYCL1PPCAC_26550 [Pristionchus mayeri]
MDNQAHDDGMNVTLLNSMVKPNLTEMKSRHGIKASAMLSQMQSAVSGRSRGVLHSRLHHQRSRIGNLRPEHVRISRGGREPNIRGFLQQCAECNLLFCV